MLSNVPKSVDPSFIMPLQETLGTVQLTPPIDKQAYHDIVATIQALAGRSCH